MKKNLKKILEILLFFCLFHMTCFCVSGKVVQEKQPSILLVHLAATWGGISQYITKLYKTLVRSNYKVYVLLRADAKTQDEFRAQRMPCFTLKKYNKNFAVNLLKNLSVICAKKNINIIHFNFPPKSYLVARGIKSLFPVKTLFTWHSPAIPAAEVVGAFDYVSAVSVDVANEIKRLNDRQQLHIKKIWHTPPCVDDERFFNYTSPQTAVDFFKKNFNIDVLDYPIVSMIASLTEYKNHECLLYAFKKLVFDLKTPAHLILVGEGCLREKIETLIKNLGLQSYVHLLGFSKEVPAILYHSDIKVLSSKGESFGAVIVEAALLKKPIVISDGVAAANYIIFPNKTGLLFRNNDSEDLALKLKILIENKELRKTLGIAAYDLVREKFTSNSLIENIKNMYDEIMCDSDK